MDKTELPSIITQVGFDFNWDEQKVWQLDVRSESMDIRELVWHFAIPFLRKEGKPYTLKPSEVMSDPETYQEEYNRTMQSDLAYPIDIMQNKGRWLILDGLHRLMKASIQRKKEVTVRKIPRDYIPKIEI